MIKTALIAASLLLAMPLPALAENGCDGPCRGGRGYDRGDRGWNRGHDHRRYDHRHERARSRVSFHFGTPYYYGHPYYHRPRVVYAPAPVVYSPQPEVIYINDQNSREVYNDEDRYCREYNATSTIGGRRQNTYGTACMQPDGSWEIMG